MIINRKNISLSNCGGTNVWLFILVAALTASSSIFASCQLIANPQFGYSTRNGRILKRLSATSTPSGLLPSTIFASGIFSEDSGKQLHLKIYDCPQKDHLKILTICIQIYLNSLSMDS